MGETRQLNDSIISQTISNLRFPLIVGIVMIHAKVPINDNVAFEKALRYFSDCLPSPCVPIFFIISSFLFFWKIDSWNFVVYRNKLRSRLRSLFVPYLIWNAIAIIVFAFIHLFFPSSINSEFNNVLEWKVQDFVKAFWDCSNSGEPINYPLWYMRNLIVMIVFSPCFYFIRGLNKLWRYLFLVLLLFIQLFVFQNGWTTAALYFYAGSILAKERTSIYELSTPKKIRDLSILTISLFLLVSLLIASLGIKSKIIYNFNRLIGVIAFILVSVNLTSYGIKVHTFVINCSLFIFLAHFFSLLVTGRLIMAILEYPQSFFMLFVAFILNVLFTISIWSLVYYILNTRFRSFLTVLIGFR